MRFTGTKPVYNFSVEKAVGISKLGTPVYDSIIIPEGTYTDIDGVTYSYESFTLENSLIVVSLKKNITLTEIKGREGVVIESANKGYYEIDFRGRIIAPWQFQPKDDIIRLNEIFRVNNPLSIYCKYLNEIFSITDIVILSNPTFAQIEGSRNTYEFSFRAVEYREMKLEYIEK